MTFGSRNSNPWGTPPIYRCRRSTKSSLRNSTQIAPVVAIVYAECNGQLSRTRAQRLNHAGFSESLAQASSFLHQWNPACRFDGPNQDKAVRASAFDEDVQEPIHPVVQIYVGKPSRVIGDEFADDGPQKCVARLVIHHRIGLGLHDDPCALAPDQFAADQLLGARDRVALEE